MIGKLDKNKNWIYCIGIVQFLFSKCTIALKSNLEEGAIVMAIIKGGKISQSFLMSNTNPKSRRQKLSVVEHYVSSALVTAYNAAADDAARAATVIGVFFDAEAALSLGVVKKREVGFAYVDNAALPPAANEKVYPFDKIGVSFTGDGEYYVSSIPGRDNDAFVVGPDGVTILVETGSAAEDYVAAFAAAILTEELAASTVVLMDVKS